MSRLTGRCSACKQIVTQDDSISHWRSEETGVFCPSAPELPSRGRYHSAEPLGSGDRLTKATPSADYEAHGTVHPCLVCGHDIKRVPGGQGPTWIHIDTGTVVCAKTKENA